MKKIILLFLPLLLILANSHVLAKPKIKHDESNFLEPDHTRHVLDEHLTLEGLVELELLYTDSDEFSEESADEFTVSTVELFAGLDLNKHISSKVGFLYEEDETDFELDYATIDFDDMGVEALGLSIGKMYLPFGRFDTSMMNDTLVLELAEIRDVSGLVTWSNSDISISSFLFKGDVESNDQSSTAMGVSTDYALGAATFGLDYLTNVYQTNLFSDYINEQDILIDDAEPAYILRGAYTIENIFVSAELFQSEELDAIASSNPKALHLEAGLKVKVWQFALAWQETEDSVELGLPESRTSVSASREFTSNAINFVVGLELFQDKDYSQSQGGSGNSASNVLLQLGLFF